jgi:hypothetical protein
MGVIKNRGFIMYGFRSRLMCLSKPWEVTDTNKKHYLTTETVDKVHVVNMHGVMVLARGA